MNYYYYAALVVSIVEEIHVVHNIITSLKEQGNAEHNAIDMPFAWFAWNGVKVLSTDNFNVCSLCIL